MSSIGSPESLVGGDASQAGQGARDNSASVLRPGEADPGDQPEPEPAPSPSPDGAARRPEYRSLRF